MFSQLTLLLLTLLFSSLSLALPQASTTRPPKGACTITSVVVDAPSVDTDGSGCRAGTVGAAISEDNSLMTFMFDDFQAAIGPQAGNVKKRALCKVNVTMSSPGWAFEVTSVDFRGYVNLGSGVDASIVSRWKWVDIASGADMKGKGNLQKKLQGPFEDDFLLHRDGEVSDSEASVCSKASARFQITISASLSAQSSALSGVVQGGSLDTAFHEILGLQWRKC